MMSLYYCIRNSLVALLEALFACTTVFGGKHYECIAQKCTHVERPHPILATYYHWDIVYSPSSEAKQKFPTNWSLWSSGIEPGPAEFKEQLRANYIILQQWYRIGRTIQMSGFKLIQTLNHDCVHPTEKFSRRRAIYLHAIQFFFASLIPVPNSLMRSGILLLACYVQWSYFRVRHSQNWPINFFVAIFTLSMYTMKSCDFSVKSWCEAETISLQSSKICAYLHVLHTHTHTCTHT